MFRTAVTEFNKQMHVRPVMFLSLVSTFAGCGLGLARAFTSGPEYTMKSYVDQNEVNMRVLIERELSAELYLLFKTNPQQIPVQKRHIWQMAGEAEEVFNKIQDLNVNENLEVDRELFDPLYLQWKSQIFDIYWTMLEQRGMITHEERVYKQQRQYSVFDLPPAKPFKIRPFPAWDQGFANDDVHAPAADAPRAEFVKYYATKYNVDL